MLERLFDLFAVKPNERPQEADDERVRMAVCVLLLEVAGADNEFSPVECERILRMLRDRFGLAQEEAESLIRDAQERRDGSSDIWKFTNQINQECSVGEKVRTIEEIWRVIYSDGTLDGHEDYLVHKLARLLNLTHPQLINAKMKVLGEIRGDARP